MEEYKFYGVEPDIANLEGTGQWLCYYCSYRKSSVMQHAQDSFISSTFWTERIGPSAALKTLEIMEREKTWDVICKQGEFLRKSLKEAAKACSIEIQFNGISSILGYSINSKDFLAYKTLITQEMLKKGYLASNQHCRYILTK